MYDENRARTATSTHAVIRDGKGGLSLWDKTKFPYREDPETGMPVPLEKNHYFHVRIKDDIITVNYMRKRWWWKDVYLSSSSTSVSDSTVLVPDDILWEALRALMEWEDRKASLARIDKLVSDQMEHNKNVLRVQKLNSRFAGKYPPKMLK